MAEISTLNGYKIKDKKAVRYYNTIADLKADTTLKNGMHAKTKGYYEPEDGGHGEYIITNEVLSEDGGLVHTLNNTLQAKLLYKDNLYVEQFGCYGDNTHDDSAKFQLAIDTAVSLNKRLVANQTYKIDSPITISGDSVQVDFSLSTINYSGNNSAIILTDLINSNLRFGHIVALSGNGLEIKATSSTDWNQYDNIWFVDIRALNYCIYLNRTGGWCNEIRFHDGRLLEGNYGVYTSSNASGPAIDNITFENVGVEGVTNGFYLCNWTESWNILNCRYHESYTTLLETVGRVRRVNFIGTGPFYPSKCNFSNQTRMKIIAPIYAPGGSQLDNGALIYDGHLKTDTYRSYVNMTAGGGTNVDLEANDFLDNTKCCPYQFLAGANTELKLNSVYGSWNGINEFLVYISMASGSPFTIKVGNTVIFNDTTDLGYKYLKFTWLPDRGWRYEIAQLNSITVNS